MSVVRSSETFFRARVSSKAGIHVKVVDVRHPFRGYVDRCLATEDVLAERRQDDLILGGVVRQIFLSDE